MLIDFFANFDKTRVIIDTTEIPINKLQNVNAKSATFLATKTKKLQSNGWLYTTKSG